MNITKKQRAYSILIFLIVFPLFSFAIYALADTVTIIDGDDIIKNFKFVSYADPTKGVFTDQNSIDQGKLRLSYGSWNVKDYDVIDVYEGEDETILTYLLNLTNVMYVYTSVPITQASSTLGAWARTSYYTVADYKKYNCFNMEMVYGTYGQMWHSYYDFGSLSSWNGVGNRHVWNGEMKFDFDISDTPFLATLRGGDGVNYDPAYSHISVYKTKVSANEYGKITEANIVDAVYPSYTETTDLDGMAGNAADSVTVPTGVNMVSGVWSWNAAPQFSSRFETGNFFDDGIVLEGVNAPLVTTRKDGTPSWVGNNISMEDGAFTLPIGRISPTVVEYGRTLSYTVSRLHFWWDICLLSTRYTSTYGFYEETKPSSLEINNRYIKYEISMEMLVSTKYNIDVYRQVGEVQKPVEYYDDLIWVSGIGGAIRGTVELPPDLLTTLFIWLILFIIVIGVILILYAFAKSRGKKNDNETKIIFSKS